MEFYTDGDIRLHLIETLGYEYVHRMNCLRRGIREQEEVVVHTKEAKRGRKRVRDVKYEKTTNRKNDNIMNIGEEIREAVIRSFGINLVTFIDRVEGVVPSCIFCYITVEVMNMRSVKVNVEMTERSRSNARNCVYKGKKFIAEGMYKDKLDILRPKLKEIATRYGLVGCEFDKI